MAADPTRPELLPEARECPKCRGTMVEGFAVDQQFGTIGQSSWAPGPPQQSFWRGLDVADDQLVPITVYRCRACGFLESYALAAVSG